MTRLCGRRLTKVWRVLGSCVLANEGHGRDTLSHTVPVCLDAAAGVGEYGQGGQGGFGDDSGGALVGESVRVEADNAAGGYAGTGGDGAGGQLTDEAQRYQADIAAGVEPGAGGLAGDVGQGYDQGERGFGEGRKEYDEGQQGYDQGQQGYDQGQQGYDQATANLDAARAAGVPGTEQLPTSTANAPGAQIQQVPVTEPDAAQSKGCCGICSVM